MKILEPIWDEIPDLPEKHIGSKSFGGIKFSAFPNGTSSNSGISANGQTNFSHEGKNPWAVTSFKDLFYHFGPWIWMLLGGQLLAAYFLADWAYDVGQKPFLFLFACQLLISLVLNFCVYFCLVGSMCSHFVKPGRIVFAATVLPGVLIRLAEYMVQLRVGQ